LNIILKNTVLAIVSIAMFVPVIMTIIINAPKLMRILTK